MVMRAFAKIRVVGLDQHRARALRLLAVRNDPEPARHLLIGLDQAAHVAAEPVLVELVAGFDVPQPAVVRRDLVGHHGAHHLALIQPAEFELEVDELDADAEKETRQEVIAQIDIAMMSSISWGWPS